MDSRNNADCGNAVQYSECNTCNIYIRTGRRLHNLYDRGSYIRVRLQEKDARLLYKQYNSLRNNYVRRNRLTNYCQASCIKVSGRNYNSGYVLRSLYGLSIAPYGFQLAYKKQKRLPRDSHYNRRPYSFRPVRYSDLFTKNSPSHCYWTIRREGQNSAGD